MNDSDTNVGARKSVVAIVKEDGRLKGVELRKRGGATEVLWAKSTESADADWQSFATECGLSVRSAADEIADGDKTVVIGFGSAGTVFNRTSMPPVEEQEIESIVKLQAETRLPLPAEQTELAWRADPVQDGQVGVTMVVARKDLLQGFVREVRSLDPTKILLDCEGIIKAWRTVFSEHEKEAVVVSIGARSTQVCLAQDGRLSNAVILDLGLEDLSGEAPAEQSETTDKTALDMGIDGFAAKAGEGQTEAAERFSQDMRSVMNLFGFADPQQVPVFVLSDDSAVYVSVVSSLRSADLNARVVLPDVRTLAAEGESGVEWIYNYRAAIGLGLMAIEDESDELNIFENVYSRFEEKETKHWLYSPKVAGAIACVMLLALAIVCYSLDMKSPKSIMQRLEASTSEAKTDLDTLVQRQRLIKMVARERPDMLALLKLVNDCGEKGVVLDSVFFKKDQKVSVMGQVQNNEQLYKFQENLDKHKDVTSVNITNSARVTSKSSGRSSSRSSAKPSEPSGKPGGPSGEPSGSAGGRSAGGSRGRGATKFTITFQYKNFSKKSTRAQG